MLGVIVVEENQPHLIGGLYLCASFPVPLEICASNFFKGNPLDFRLLFLQEGHDSEVQKQSTADMTAFVSFLGGLVFSYISIMSFDCFCRIILMVVVLTLEFN